MSTKYVTFEQAQWLKKKEFDEDCSFVYSLDMVGDKIPHVYESKYYNHKHEHIWLRPEQHQVVDWLLENHGIWVEVRRTFYLKEIRFQAYYNEKPVVGVLMGGYLSYKTPQEAYSSAFDYIKNNNLI